MDGGKVIIIETLSDAPFMKRLLEKIAIVSVQTISKFKKLRVLNKEN